MLNQSEGLSFVMNFEANLHLSMCKNPTSSCDFGVSVCYLICLEIRFCFTTLAGHSKLRLRSIERFAFC